MNSKIVFHEQKMEIPVKTGFVARHYHELMYIVYDAPYCWLHFTGKTRYKVEVTLQYLMERLPKTTFFQCNRSAILNLHCYREYRKKDEMVVMDDGMELNLARRRVNDFHDLRKNY